MSIQTIRDPDQILATLPIAFYVTEAPGGAIRAWNRRAVDLWGREPTIGESDERFLRLCRTDGTPAPHATSPTAEVLRTGEPQTGDIEIERSDGARLTVRVHTEPLHDSGGRLTGAVNAFQDITAQKHTEENTGRHLRTVGQLYRLADRVSRARTLDEICESAVEAIVETVGVQRASILMFDDHDRMRFKAWRGLSAAYRAAVDGHSPWTPDASMPTPILVEDVLTDPNVAALRAPITSEGIRALGFIPLIYGGRLLGKFMLYCDAPHRFSTEEVGLAATIAQHVAFGIARAQADTVIAAALDRERAARAEADAARAEAERVSQAKDEFLAMLAHELRNPLGVITTALAVLEGDRGNEPRYERPRAAIQRQTEHLARLLDDLLDVARITKGQIQLHEEPVDLRVVVELGVENQRHRADPKKQQLFTSVPAHPVIVSGDSVRLQQVFGNILNNASKYTDVGGTISVALGVEGDTAVLCVRDNGAGIAPDRLEWIFELFTQASPTLARTEGGLGIGLTVAKRLVELHKGRIRATSEGLGCGTEVVVELPLAAATALPASATSPARRVTPRRILVIEDNNDGREMLVAALQLDGHQMFEAATGRDGIEQAKLNSPDVVLIDIGLPDIDGYAVAKELRRTAGSGVRLIALTGYGGTADRARSEEVGFQAHLLKPIDPSDLGDVLERLM